MTCPVVRWCHIRTMLAEKDLSGKRLRSPAIKLLFANTKLNLSGLEQLLDEIFKVYYKLDMDRVINLHITAKRIATVVSQACSKLKV